MEQQRKAPSEISLSSVQRVAQLMQRLKEQDDKSLAAQGLRPNADPQSVAVAAMVLRRNPRLLQEFRQEYVLQQQEKEFSSIDRGAKEHGYNNDGMLHARVFGEDSGAAFDVAFDPKAVRPAPKVEKLESPRARQLPQEWLQEGNGASIQPGKAAPVVLQPKPGVPLARTTDNVSEGKREQLESQPAQQKTVRPPLPAKPAAFGSQPPSLYRKEELLKATPAQPKPPAPGNRIAQLKDQLEKLPNAFGKSGGPRKPQP
jgi:hypothetical protein